MSAPVLVGPSSSSGGPAPFEDLEDLVADIGDRIRAERQARGWTIQQLAVQAGLPRITVKRLEAGAVSLRVFAQACAVLQIDMAYVLSDQWAPPARTSEADEPPVLSPQQALVVREAAAGGTLAEVGDRLGMSSRRVGTVLSEAYVRLGVSYLPRRERRQTALRVAAEHGLIIPQKRTS